MRVLAIDPGNTESAFCLVADYVPIAFDKVENQDLLHRLREFLPFNPEGPDKVVIERIASYGMAVGREVFETCEWIGRFAEASERAGVPVDYIFRKEEKLHLCHDSRAKDTNIRRALIDRFAIHDLKNGKGTKDKPDFFYGFKADIWAAYAVAITYIETKESKDAH